MKIISDIDLTLDELLMHLKDKRNIFDKIKDYYGIYDFKVINMHRGGHVIRVSLDEDHLLFNLAIEEEVMIAKLRLEPRVNRIVSIGRLSEDGKKAYSQKRFCQTGFWLDLTLSNDTLEDLFYFVDLKIANYERVLKKEIS